jgi:AcrR family transcriptional regulator
VTREAAKAARLARDAEREDEILAVAAELFYERGFTAVTINDIARGVGVTAPAIYRLFPSKDDILAAIFDEGLDLVVRVTAGTAPDPFDELDHLIREHTRHVLEHPFLANAWMHEDRFLVEPHRRRYLRRASTYIGRWVECLGRCFPAADPPAVVSAAHAVLGMLNALPARPGDGVSEDDLVALVASHARAAFDVLGTPASARSER